jgi:hypothetical protein
MTLDTHDERAAEWTDAAPVERFILTQLLAEQKAYRRWSKDWRRCSKTIRVHREMMRRWYGPQSVRALDDDDVRLLQRFHQVDLSAAVRTESGGRRSRVGHLAAVFAGWVQAQPRAAD